ncbi:SGNH/GDSL hydrolase family protein [Chondromyces crocatus]|uniref:SGNH hydrolase-type esterase domain-containing protein n=1 Tax=Chondromyces crocatus TaxID=52 RepID=A0A0K1EHD4_CHOCO|nr:SGNH/GDSL hydrolase family protein [Chondromyces crocatus]AKT40008.1 uncharacterized protein CMC5_041610 [Chondromyces crocatus]
MVKVHPIGRLWQIGACILGVSCGSTPPASAPSSAGAAAGQNATEHRDAAPLSVRPAAASSAPGESSGQTGEVSSTGKANATSAQASVERAPPPPIPPRTAVLHIGDSFTLAGFAQALKPRMKALGVRYEVKAEQSSYTVTWAPKMELLVANTQPDLVIISLGANEVANTDPPAHGPAIRRLVQSIGKRPCVWVAPPLWRKDTGIIDVIRENSAPCRFFDSDSLVKGPIPRQSDKIHPNEEGGALWAEAFWQWLETERARAGEVDAAGVSAGGASGEGRSPWALRAGPVEEHRARPVSGGSAAVGRL